MDSTTGGLIEHCQVELGDGRLSILDVRNVIKEGGRSASMSVFLVGFDRCSIAVSQRIVAVVERPQRCLQSLLPARRRCHLYADPRQGRRSKIHL